MNTNIIKHLVLATSLVFASTLAAAPGDNRREGPKGNENRPGLREKGPRNAQFNPEMVALVRLIQMSDDQLDRLDEAIDRVRAMSPDEKEEILEKVEGRRKELRAKAENMREMWESVPKETRKAYREQVRDLSPEERREHRQAMRDLNPEERRDAIIDFAGGE